MSLGEEEYSSTGGIIRNDFAALYPIYWSEICYRRKSKNGKDEGESPSARSRSALAWGNVKGGQLVTVGRGSIL
jgi:hypothetical protein